MPFSALEHYLARLSDTQTATRVRLDSAGRAQGRYFNATLTSAFQPLRTLDAATVVGFEGLARSYSPTDQGLSLWKLLDQAANDDESIELDRLCRMLHAINFFRQPDAEGADLFLHVHARLLAAVDSNHGTAFRRILAGLELPQERIVLQLPAAGERQNWLLNYVADNYRGNGFRIAINAADPAEALRLLDRIRPEFIKVDARQMPDEAATGRLITECAGLSTRLIFKRVENPEVAALLRQFGARNTQPIYVQGFLWDLPKPDVRVGDAVGRIQQRMDAASMRTHAQAR